MNVPVANYDRIDPTFFVAEVDGFRLFRSINPTGTSTGGPNWLIEGAGSFTWTSLLSMCHHPCEQKLVNGDTVPPHVITRFLPFAELITH